MHHENQKTIAKILSKISGKNIKNINLNTDIRGEINLDSIQMVELFAMLEKEFDIELPLEMMNSKTGQQFMEMLNNELLKKKEASTI